METSTSRGRAYFMTSVLLLAAGLSARAQTLSESALLESTLPASPSYQGKVAVKKPPANYLSVQPSVLLRPSQQPAAPAFSPAPQPGAPAFGPAPSGDTYLQDGSETALAVNYADGNNLIGVFNREWSTVDPLMNSIDGNGSWTSRTFPTGVYTGDPFDPWANAGNTPGEFFSMLIRFETNTALNSHVIIARSSDAGASFSLFFEKIKTTPTLQDRAMFDVDRTSARGGGSGTTHDGKIYLCYDERAAEDGSYLGSFLQIISPAGEALTEIQLSGPPGGTNPPFRGNFFQPVAGTTDGTVYFHSDSIGGTPFGAVRAARFRDMTNADPDSITFRNLISSSTPGQQLGTNDKFGVNGHRIDPFGYLDIDRSSGPRRGYLYYILNHNPYPSDPTHDQGDIYLCVSTNGAVNWNIALMPTAPGKTQFGPMMDVDDQGWVHVAYYQNESGSVNGGVLNASTVNIYYTVSVDGGSTWSTPIQANAPENTLNLPDPPPDRSANDFYLIGDYAQIQATGTGTATKAYILWASYNNDRSDAVVGEGKERVICTTITNICTAPEITRRPLSQWVCQGDTARLCVEADGTGPLSYQWFIGGDALVGETANCLETTNESAAPLSVIVSNACGSVTSALARVTVLTCVPLAEALDQPNWTWRQSDDAWLGQTRVSHDGTDAAGPPALAPYQESWIETDLTGPGTLKFWLKPPGAIGDLFDLLIDEVSQQPIDGQSGEQPWQFITVRIPEGSHVVKWLVRRGGERPEFENNVWVDEVMFTPDRYCLVHYKFDEASGVVALDSSGNTNHGVLLNGPVRTNGVVGRALRFDGSNDRVRATNATALNVSGAFTVACWVRPESVTDSPYFVIKGNSSDDRFAYALRASSAKVQYRWVSPSGSKSAFGTRTNVLVAGRWTHVAVAHTPGSLPTLFINGVAVPGSLSSGSAAALVGTSSNAFTVGSSADGKGQFKGSIDEVFVCPGALSAAQVQNLTNGLPPGPPPPLAITSTSPLPGGRVNATYSQTLMATGGTPGFTWSIVSGALPGGLTLNTNSGVIGGTPTMAGTNMFRARVRDSAAQINEKDLTLVVTNPPPPVITTASPLPTGTVSNAYSTTLMATSGLPPYNWSIVSGALPSGLMLNTNTGVISGTPTSAGTNNFRARVTDNAGQTGEKDFVLPISNAAGCLVYYKFDEPSGTNAIDSSGNGNNGILLNGPTHTNGMVGLALRFDGLNDRVSGGNSSSLNHTGALTIAAWVRPESVTDKRIIVIKGNISSEGYAWALRASDAKLLYRWVSPNGTESIFKSANDVLAIGRWTHVAAVHTPGSLPMLYTNGVLISGSLTDGSATAGIGVTPNAFTVGSSSDASQRFQGIIDEVIVCGSALASADLRNLMIGQPPGSMPPMAPSPLLPSGAAPLLVELRVAGEVATISWSAVAGAIYRIQYKNNLDDAEWQELPDEVIAYDTPVSVDDFLDGQAQRFYRVVAQP